MSTKTMIILGTIFIVVLIIIGIFVVKDASRIRVEDKNYKYDDELGDKIDAVVKSNDELLNELNFNQVEHHKEIFENVEIRANELAQH